MKVLFFFVLFIISSYLWRQYQDKQSSNGAEESSLYFETWTRTDEYTGFEGTKVDVVQGVHGTFRVIQA